MMMNNDDGAELQVSMSEEAEESRTEKVGCDSTQ